MGVIPRLFLIVLMVAVAAVSARRVPPAQAAPVLQIIASVKGQPDDIATDTQGRLVWGDLANGTVDRLDGRRVVTLVRGLSVPEGIVTLPHGDMVIAEQGSDRIVQINSHGALTVLYTLQPVPGQEGVDGIGRNPRSGDLLIPDSPRGTVLRLSANGHQVHQIAGGLGRPVDAAVDARGNVLVPDEHLGALVVVTPRGRISYRGGLSIPDDVAVTTSGRIWITTLGDGGLWLIAPGAAPRRILTGLANPQGLTLDRCGDPIIVEQTGALIVRLLLTPASRTCHF